jgi:flagellar biosynthesis/type III secretory pathway M-ring protein FliF/YscJ
MKKSSFKRINNKKGFIIMFIMILIVLIVYWRMTYSTSVISYVSGLQNTEMNRIGVVIDQREIPAFELR